MIARTLLLLALLTACSRTETAAPEPTPAAPSAANSSAAATPAVTGTFEDPEPADAQARAEAVVNADFNRDKTTRLQMNITTIVSRTSTLQGMASALAAREDKIEDRLSRLAAKVTDTEVVIQLPGAILFDFDSDRIRADAERSLNDVAQVIQAYTDRPVRVEGHTDSVASDDYNQALSEKRAKSVVAWLSSHGVKGARLSAAGHGEKKPVATNDTAAGRQANRRVEVVIAKK